MATAIVLTEKREDLPDTPGVLTQFQVVCDLRTQLNDAQKELARRVKGVQETCRHDFKKVMEYDKNYCGRVDGIGRGQEVFVGEKCKKCRIFKPRQKGPPWQICYECGGDMKYDHQEHCGEDCVHVHKCKSCGHEHDTT